MTLQATLDARRKDRSAYRSDIRKRGGKARRDATEEEKRLRKLEARIRKTEWKYEKAKRSTEEHKSKHTDKKKEKSKAKDGGKGDTARNSKMKKLADKLEQPGCFCRSK